MPLPFSIHDDALIVGDLLEHGWALSFFVFEGLGWVSIPSVLLRRQGRPSAALAWLVSLVAFPFLSVPFWWVFGRMRLERAHRQHAQARNALPMRREQLRKDQTRTFDELLPDRARADSVFTSDGNQTHLLIDGQEAFPAMREAIGNARQTLHALFYIFEVDETGRALAELLARKSKEGVKVRLMVDGRGSHRSVGWLQRTLKPAGVEVSVFLPSPFSPLHAPRINFVNHRKLVVADDRIAFVGGMNIGDDYAKRWRDLMLRIEGPAVRGLNQIFLEDWYFTTGIRMDEDADESLPSSGTDDVAVVASGPDTEPWIHDAYFLAVTRAERRVWIATPYFIPSPALLTALRTAAGRGVEVKVIVPRHSDVRWVEWAARSFYEPLVEAGVEVREYLGPMLHAKALVCDENLCSVGSANLDSRSFSLSFEVTCFVTSVRLTAQLEAWFRSIMADAAPVLAEQLRQQGVVARLLQSAAHLMSPAL